MLIRVILVLGLILKGIPLLLSFNTQYGKYRCRRNNYSNRHYPFIRNVPQVKTRRSVDPLYAQSEDKDSKRLLSRLLGAQKKRATASDAPLKQSVDNIVSKEWESKTVPELKNLLRSKNLKVSGTKRELLRRIEENKLIFTDAAGIKTDIDAEESTTKASNFDPIRSSPLDQIYASDMSQVIKSKIGELESEAYEKHDDEEAGRAYDDPSSSSSSSASAAIEVDESSDDDEEYENEDLGGGDPTKTNIYDFDDFDELELYMEEGGMHLNETTLFSPLEVDKPIDPRETSSPSLGNRLGLKESFRSASQEEIQALVDRRTNARKSVDFATADAIKTQLEEEYGVEIFDSLGIWKSVNGRSGRLASLDELSDTPCTLTEKEVQVLVIQRTIARRNRNFQLADDIRQQLTVAGVELNDPENTWRSFDGAISGFQSMDYDKRSSTGPTINYECNLTQEEAQDLIDQRTECRRNRDYETADVIKAKLKASGIDVVDREGTWSALDGSISGFQQKLKTSVSTRDEVAFDKRRKENPDPPTLTEEQVQKLVDIRTNARKNRNYELADSIEEDLHNSGIFLNNRANTWKAYDGSIEGFQSVNYNTGMASQEARNTPCTLSEDEAQELVDQRAEARSRRDFRMADEIKQQLIQSGIGLFDNEYRWSAYDRSISGSIPRYEMQETPCMLAMDEIQAMVDDRTAARRVRDFKTADAIKRELMEGGIQLFDKENRWQAYDGSIQGMQSTDFKGGTGKGRNVGENSYYRTEPVPCTLSFDEIQKLIDERTVARRRRNFAIADEIRDELASKGVEVVDKENIWRTFDRSMSGMQSDGYGSGAGSRGERAPPIWARDREDGKSNEMQSNTKFEESGDDEDEGQDDYLIDNFMDDLLSTTSEEDGIWID